jgi:hypothetical protein
MMKDGELYDMRKLLAFLVAVLAIAETLLAAGPLQQQRVSVVGTTKGLIAFWDFSLMKDGTWTSHHDKAVADHGYPIFLRRIGDPKSYKPENWHYKDDASKLVFDSSGPFGHAVRLNRGYIFAEVPRGEFDKSPLDIHGRQPFTLIAWVKFIGQRHLVAGIWDEGGWSKYGGRRQIALFGGLFGSKGVIGHISSTGAASYPQSTVSGSQYARCRAIDGHAFPNDQWVAMAMSFDPIKGEVIAYCNGVATPTRITDPVAQDVFRYEKPVASNPFSFPWLVYSPRCFVLKFNGYDARSSGIFEHWLQVDTEKGIVTYGRTSGDATKTQGDYRVQFDVKRGGKSLLPSPIVLLAKNQSSITLPEAARIQTGDEIVTSLENQQHGEWQRVGSEIHYPIQEGAPFTFGRALGLGKEAIDHGTELFIDGVAVFNRVLDEKELRAISFEGR